MLGNPLCANECTSKIKRISYAKVRIELDVTKEILQVVHVEHLDGRLFKQRVTYKWLPYFCIKCYEVGHICDQRSKANWKWVPKNPVAEGEPSNMVTQIVI